MARHGTRWLIPRPSRVGGSVSRAPRRRIATGMPSSPSRAPGTAPLRRAARVGGLDHGPRTCGHDRRGTNHLGSAAMHRTRFPGLADGWARLDGAAGTQMVDDAIEEMAAWMRSGHAANHGGAFLAAERTDAL